MDHRLLLALALASCRAAPPPKAAPVSNAVAADADIWKQVEALAAPTHDGAASPSLDRALAKRDASALVQWMQESGALRSVHRSSIDTVAALELGRKTIEEATTFEPVVAVARLGLYLVQDGTSFYDAEIGIELIELVPPKLRALGEPANGFERPQSTDLLRIIAAEALTSRALLETLDTPEGRKAMAANGWDAELYESLRRFWPPALNGATRGEPASSSLTRLSAAAETIRTDPGLVRTTVRSAEFIAKKLEALERLAP